MKFDSLSDKCFNSRMAKNQPRNLPNTASDAAAQAREQADAYDSVFSDTDLELNDGTIVKIPPHPDLGMIDDERMEAYEELLYDVDENYDREESIVIPEQRLRDPSTGEENGVVIPETTQRGMLKTPYRKNNELVKPPHSVKVVIAALGEDVYAQIKAGGKSAKDVWRIWNERNLEIQKRRTFRSQTDGSSVGMASVS